jgi:hypothetical protein
LKPSNQDNPSIQALGLIAVNMRGESNVIFQRGEKHSNRKRVRELQAKVEQAAQDEAEDLEAQSDGDVSMASPVQ